MPLINNVNQLNERIAFLTPIWGTNKIGDKVITGYEELGSCWAMVRTQTLSEVYAGGSYHTDQDVQFVVRSQLPYKIISGNTLRWRGADYTIMGVNPDSQNQEWDVIITKEKK